MIDDNQTRKVLVLWAELEAVGALRDSSHSALNAFCKRVTGVDNVEWIGMRQVSNLIEALKAWLARHQRQTKASMSDRPCRVGAPVFFASLAELSAAELVNAGITDEATVTELGDAIARRVAFDWGGVRLYVLDGTANARATRWLERQERDAQIHRLYTDRNIHELCDRFCHHPATVRKLIKGARLQLRDAATAARLALPSPRPCPPLRGP